MAEITLRAGESDWLNRLITDAIGKRASDVHIEPQREKIQVKFRIDGMLRDIEHINLDNTDSTTSRIKVLAGLDITEHRLPQDGHFEFNYDIRVYNVRVSTFPKRNQPHQPTLWNDFDHGAIRIRQNNTSLLYSELYQERYKQHYYH